jgi:hypothetical protein
MKIVPITYGCPRDSAILCLLVKSLRSLKDPRLAPHVVVLGNTSHPGDGLLPQEDMRFLNSNGVKFLLREPGWGNGGHWQGGLMKIKTLRSLYLYGHFNDDDYVLSVDSDVIFTSSRIFDELNGSAIAGLMQSTDLPITQRFGPWSHVSGACMFIRGDIARQIGELPLATLQSINEEFGRDNLATNEDIVLSYVANYLGVKSLKLNHHVAHDYDSFFRGNPVNGSFFHFNMGPCNFMGVPVTGKWDIPRALVQLGLDPFPA